MLNEIFKIYNDYFSEESNDYKVIYKLIWGKRIADGKYSIELVIRRIYKLIPPDYLYAGAGNRDKISIMLSKKLFNINGKFQLADSKEKALAFGKYVYKINTKQMYNDGYLFYEDYTYSLYDENNKSICIVDEIPAKYVVFED